MFSIRSAVAAGAFACGLVLAGSEQFALGQPKDKPLEPYINPKTKRDEADEQLEKLKARVKRDTSKPGHPVVEVKVFSQDVAADDLKELAVLTNVEELTISGFSFSDEAFADTLKGLKRLQKLNANNCKVGDKSMKALSELPEVRSVVLFGSAITDAGYAHIGKIEKLEELRTSYSISDAGLAHLGGLKNLKTLNLWNSFVSMKAVRALPNLNSLKELEISTQRIKEGEAKKLAEELPGCKVVYKK